MGPTLRIIAAVLVALALVPGAGPVAAQEKKLVRIWHTETEPQTVAVINQIIADFERRRPDVTVKAEALAWATSRRS